MGMLKTLGLAGAIAAGFAAPAFAADMLFPPPMIGGMVGTGAPGLVELGSGWYLRGDAAYVDYVNPKDRGEAIVDQRFDTAKLETTWSAGGGFGYKFVNWFRADVTIDHRLSSGFEGAGSLAGFGSGSRYDRAHFESTTGLVNGYIDFGAWSGITPYVGAGVGAAMNLLTGYTVEATCLMAGCGPIGRKSTLTMPTSRMYDFAWALMGGVAVQVGGGFQVDLGYRYVNLGEARLSFGEGNGATRGKDIEAHEVRLGLRYMID